MNTKNKRILWICNHSTLMDVECKLLVDLGFEVFVPKILNQTRSFSLNFEYDKTLTIELKDLEKLNSFNFYKEAITADIAKIINDNFSVVICINLPPVSYNIAKAFNGILILRVFGHEDNKTYEFVISQFSEKIKGFKHLLKPLELKYDNEILRQYHKIKNRFYLGAAYQSIIEGETPFLKKRSVYLPLGIPKFIWENEGSWIGSENKIMFVCPSIDTSYYKKIYDKFKSNFNTLPHTIFGNQKQKYAEDKNVIGFLEKDEFDECMKKYKVMFYHSQEKKHLHYHPLEAIVFGMPLIYMAGGLLETFGGQNQPGMAKTTEEAKTKIKRILDNDVTFINNVKEEQVKILDKFKYGYVKKYWQENFLPLIGE